MRQDNLDKLSNKTLKCNSSPEKHVFFYLFPDCLCIIIHFSASPDDDPSPGFVFIRTGVQTEKSN